DARMVAAGRDFLVAVVVALEAIAIFIEIAGPVITAGEAQPGTGLLFLAADGMSGIGRPDGLMILIIDDGVPVVLDHELPVGMADGPGGPDGPIVIVVDDQVAVSLHRRHRAPLADGIARPERMRALVENQVAVLLHRQHVARVGRGYRLAGQEKDLNTDEGVRLPDAISVDVEDDGIPVVLDDEMRAGVVVGL